MEKVRKPLYFYADMYNILTMNNNYFNLFNAKAGDVTFYASTAAKSYAIGFRCQDQKQAMDMKAGEFENSCIDLLKSNNPNNVTFSMSSFTHSNPEPSEPEINQTNSFAVAVFLVTMALSIFIIVYVIIYIFIYKN